MDTKETAISWLAAVFGSRCARCGSPAAVVCSRCSAIRASKFCEHFEIPPGLDRFTFCADHDGAPRAAVLAAKYGRFPHQITAWSNQLSRQIAALMPDHSRNGEAIVSWVPASAGGGGVIFFGDSLTAIAAVGFIALCMAVIGFAYSTTSEPPSEVQFELEDLETP